MSYKLTLTKDERDAIDWVGYRYSNGDELRNLLEESKVKVMLPYDVVNEVNECDIWNTDCILTFDVPENLAWSIKENANQEDGDSEYTFPCFSEELSNKLVSFCEEIV